MFWPPNSEGVIWWLRNGYESLRAICPDLIYDIVGPRPPRALQALAKRCKGIKSAWLYCRRSTFWTSATALVSSTTLWRRRKSQNS